MRMTKPEQEERGKRNIGAVNSKHHASAKTDINVNFNSEYAEKLQSQTLEQNVLKSQHVHLIAYVNPKVDRKNACTVLLSLGLCEIIRICGIPFDGLFSKF